MKENNYEIVKFEDGDFKLDVRVSPNEETVWLTQKEMAMLFDVTVDNISLHINNILKDNELEYSVVEESSVTASDGKNYTTKIYNLDMIISVGYRVKSKRGILFRRWANGILKSHLLNGYSINQNRMLDYSSNILRLETDVFIIKNRLKDVEESIYKDNNQIIFEGEIIKPYSFIIKLFYLAKNRIIIIDRYADKLLLDMLYNIKVNVTIYTSKDALINKEIVSNNIKIVNTELIHDRIITIDDTSYILGTSINSIGKKRFFILKMEDIKIETILKGIE